MMKELPKLESLSGFDKFHVEGNQKGVTIHWEGPADGVSEGSKEGLDDGALLGFDDCSLVGFVVIVSGMQEKSNYTVYNLLW